MSGGIEFLPGAVLRVALTPDSYDAFALAYGLTGAWQTIASRSGSGPWSGPSPVNVAPVGDGRVSVVVRRALAGRPQEFYRLKVRLRP